MKYYIFLLISGLFLFGISCSQGNKNQYTERTVESGDTLPVVPEEPKIISPVWENGKAEIEVFKYEQQTVQVNVNSSGYKWLYARLTSNDQQANLSFEEIIDPQGESDDALGRELSHSLSKEGIYRLMITDNKMGGEPWSGDFKVELELFTEYPTIHLNPTDINVIRIIYTDDETIEKYISEVDTEQINYLLQDAIYDAEWNDSGIMIAMIAPDYTLIVNYKNKSEESNDWLMIWKESGKIKYRNIWYIVDKEKIEKISQILDSYRK